MPFSWKSLKVDPDPVAVLLPEPLATEVRALAPDRTAAIRLVRQRTGLNLLPAVRAVDALVDGPTGQS